MTIKQLGGIFGRNPTFNDVDAENIQTDQITATSTGVPITSVRTDSDGSIQDWYRDASKLVDLAGYSGDVWFRVTGRAGLRYTGASIIPLSNGAVSNNGIDIGSAIYQIRKAYVGTSVVMANGAGIDFSATSGTGTSELFDDYEEGTWTPTLVGSTSAGTATFVSGPTGIYTKIGNQVTVYFDWNISAHTGTGALRVNGLPFAKVAGVGVGTIMDGNYTYSAGRPRLVPYVVGSVLRFYGVGDGVGYLENALDTSHQINGSVTYTV